MHVCRMFAYSKRKHIDLHCMDLISTWCTCAYAFMPRVCLYLHDALVHMHVRRVFAYSRLELHCMDLISTGTCACACMPRVRHVCMYIHTRIHMYACTFACMYVCVCVFETRSHDYMRVRARTHMRTHVYTHMCPPPHMTCILLKVVKRIIGQWLHATATAFFAAWAQAVEASKVNKGKKFKKQNASYTCVCSSCVARTQ